MRKGFGSPPPAGFEVIRPLINFFIRDADGNAVTSFDPKMQLIVRFTQHDLDVAGELKQDLVFAYYDQNQEKWIKHSPGLPNVRRHTFFDGFEGFNGFCGFDAITLDTWPGDPGGAWGV